MNETAENGYVVINIYDFESKITLSMDGDFLEQITQNAKKKINFCVYLLSFCFSHSVHIHLKWFARCLLIYLQNAMDYMFCKRERTLMENGIANTGTNTNTNMPELSCAIVKRAFSTKMQIN